MEDEVGPDEGVGEGDGDAVIEGGFLVHEGELGFLEAAGEIGVVEIVAVEFRLQPRTELVYRPEADDEGFDIGFSERGDHPAQSLQTLKGFLRGFACGEDDQRGIEGGSEEVMGIIKRGLAPLF